MRNRMKERAMSKLRSRGYTTKDLTDLGLITLEHNIKKNMLILLKMAKDGEDKPTNKKDKLSGRLQCYTNKNSKEYDSFFNLQIRNIRPDWFITQDDLKKINEQLLLDMAINGEERPKKYKLKLGNLLVSYTNGNNIGSKFDLEIRKIRPDWFIDLKESSKSKKFQLLTLAKSKKDRPKQSEILGRALANYVSKSGRTYDSAFDLEIRILAPHWFKDNS